MSNGEQDNAPHFHREGDAVIFDPPEDQREAARRRREDEQHEFARDQVRTNQRLAWFTGFLVLGTFCGIGIGIWQATISQTAVNVAGRTLDETVRSNKSQELANTTTFQATIDNFHLEQRGWLTLEFSARELFVGKPVVSSIEISNTGKTPIIGAHGWVAFTPIDRTATITFNPHFDAVKFAMPTLFPDQKHEFPVALLYKTSTMNEPQPRILSPQGITLLQSGEASLYTYGRIDYKDVFGIPHWIKFCKFSSPPQENKGGVTPPKPPDTRSANSNQHKCNQYNDIDK